MLIGQSQGKVLALEACSFTAQETYCNRVEFGLDGSPWIPERKSQLLTYNKKYVDTIVLMSGEN